MRLVVIGHVEWVEFARVPELPRPGEIVHATETWEEAAGGGAVAAVQLAKLDGEAVLFTALGEDELGERSLRQLAAQGVRVEAAPRREPDAARVHARRRGRRADDHRPRARSSCRGSRTRSRGRSSSARTASSSSRATRSCCARRARARVLVATARELRRSPRQGSSSTRSSAARTTWGRRSSPATSIRRRSCRSGRRAGRAAGRTRAGPSRPRRSRARSRTPTACGDAFAAGLTFALARGDELRDAIALAARCGAAALTGRGAYAGQLGLRQSTGVIRGAQCTAPLELRRSGEPARPLASLPWRRSQAERARSGPGPAV